MKGCTVNTCIFATNANAEGLLKNCGGANGLRGKFTS